MWWLWIVGPIGVALIYILTGLRPDRRRSVEVTRWKGDFAKALNKGKAKATKKGSKKGDSAPKLKEVTSIPSDLAYAVDQAAAGVVESYIELAPKLAYLAFVTADAASMSDAQIVVAKLAKVAPSFVARPLPIVEGSRVANTGIKFKKDPEFMDLFMVEGGEVEAITKWLRSSIRGILCENPNVWLITRGRVMAVVLYGAAGSDDIDALVSCADSIFGEVGAEGAPSLIGEETERDASDEDEDEEGDENDDEADENEGDDEADEDEGESDDESDDEEDEDEDEGDESEAKEAKPAPKPAATSASATKPTPKPAATSAAKPTPKPAPKPASKAAATSAAKPAAAKPAARKG